MAVGQQEVADRELIAKAGQGDRAAFEALYERHFRGLYDFALRIVRDADLAADVVQSTFVKAWDAAQKQKGVENVKAWLYTVAHNLAIDELRMRKRFVGPREGQPSDQEGFPFAIPDPSRLADPEAVVQDRELVALVWDSAAALNPQEYALLDLHLRRGLDADELAEHLNLGKGAVYTRLSRLRDSLEEAVTTTLLMRRGRRECAELDTLLARLRATEATQPVRRAIKEHLKECQVCQESKRRLVSPAEIFAGISLVPVSLELMEEVWARIAAEVGLVAGAVAGAHAAASGDPAASASASSTTAAKGVAASALATGAAIVIATSLVFRGGGSVEDPTDVRSTTHAVGQPSSSNVVSMGWSRVGDADAYSVSWDRGQALPDERADLGGEATAATSPRLAPGSWYFNLRTRGDGEWTNTVHVGPFIILGGDAATRSTLRTRPAGVGFRAPTGSSAASDGTTAAALPALGPALVAMVAGASQEKGSPDSPLGSARSGVKVAVPRPPGIGPIVLSPPAPPRPLPPAPPPPQPQPPPPLAPPSPPPPPPPPPAEETTGSTTTTTEPETTTSTTTTAPTTTTPTRPTTTTTTTTVPDDEGPPPKPRDDDEDDE